MAVSQDGYPLDFGTPLLFTLPSEQPADFRTPPADFRGRPVHSPLRESGTISSTRRSATPTGSVHTDTTPPRPPPILRLQDTLMADVEAASGASPLGAAPASEHDAAAAAAAAAAPQAGPSSSWARGDQHSQTEDTWVTVFGFSPEDLPLVLREFQLCGDILQWGTFGASPQSNFMHIQYQNKYGAQRALLRSGEQLSSSLIIGVKQLEPRHMATVQAWSVGDGSPGPHLKAAAGPVRPYKVELPQAQVLPQRSRSWAQKVGEYVFGL